MSKHRIAVASLVFAIAASVLSPRAATFSVFGPRTYVRTTGAPNVFDATFTVGNPALPYTLRIDNHGVTSAVVTLNGVQILSPRDFERSKDDDWRRASDCDWRDDDWDRDDDWRRGHDWKGLIQRTVTLRATNTLRVELRSKPGTHLQLQITGSDAAPPTITATAAPPANAAGWNNTDVQVTFACSDAGAGIKSCPSPRLVTTEGAGQVIAGTATDNAGNSATAKVTLNIDKTLPTMSPTVTPQPDSGGWNRPPVKVSFTCGDSLSGIASCTPPVNVSTEGVNQSVTGVAVDRAGNVTRTTVTVNVDATAPTISTSIQPAANTAGWRNAPTTVTFVCSDIGSGIASCPAAIAVTSEGAGQSFSGTAVDRAGNTATATASVSLDATPPTVSITNPANNAIVQASPLTITGSVSDALSGIATVLCGSSAATAANGSFTCSVPLNPGTNAFTVVATDAAGNTTSSPGSVILNRAPIASAGGPYTGVAGAAIAFSGSGSSDPDNDVLTETWDFGDGQSGSGTAPTHIYAAAGSYTVTLTVTDGRGGNATATATAVVTQANRPPVVSAGGPYSGVSGTPVQFNASATDPDNDAVTFIWDFGDGSPAVGGQSVSHTFAMANDYTVSVTGDDGHGGRAVASVSIHVVQSNRPPTASAGGPYTGIDHTPIAFTATASDPDNDALTYLWDFGDSSGPASGAQTSHAYAAPNDYTATLTVTDGRGGTAIATASVHVASSEHPPTGSAGGPYSGVAGSPIQFTATATDPDNDLLSFAWDFGDGATGSGSSPSHAYAAAGTYNATLTVSDGRGGTASASATVTVTAVRVNQAPTVSAGAAQAITLPAGASLNGSVTDDGLPAAAIVTSTWTVVSGPGSVVFQDAASPTTTATFAQAGTYVLRLSASDTQFTTFGDTTVTVNAANLPPIAVAGGPYVGVVGQAIAFNGSQSSDPDNDPLAFSWSFGDGATATGPTPTHAYTTADRFTVTLTVSDGRGGTSTATVFATTTQANRSPVVSIGGPYSGSIRSAITFAAIVSDPDGDPVTVSWDFGDAGSTGSGATSSHRYAAPGTYTVRVTATDSHGASASDSASVSVVVVNGPPSFTSSPTTAAKHQAPYSYQAAAADPDGDAITFSLAQFPTGMVVDSQTGLIQWTPTGNQLGDQAVTIVATDTFQAQATQSFTISVVDATSPVVTLAVPTEALPGSTVTATAVATDNVGVASITFEVNGADPIVQVAAPFQRSIPVPQTALAGTEFHVRATARDAAGNAGVADATYKVAATADVQPPTVSLNAPANAAPGSSIHLTATSRDNVGVKSVTFKMADTVLQVDGDAPYEATYTVPGDTGVGTTLSFSARATDYSNNIGDASASVAIVAAPDVSPPHVQLVSDATVAEGGTLSLSATADDDVGVAEVVFSVNGVPVGAASSSPYTASYALPPTVTGGDMLHLEAKAVDFAGNIATSALDAEVTAAPNRPPTAAAGGPYTGEVGDAIQLDASASNDPDQRDRLTFDWNFGDSSTGSGRTPMHVYANEGTYTVTVTVSDGHGGSSSDTASVVVATATDRAPPSIALSGPSSVLPGTQVTMTAQASDNKGVVAVSFDVNGTDQSDTTTPPYQRIVSVPAVAMPGDIIKVHAVARDAAGNTASADASLTISGVADTQKPSVTLNAPPQVAAGATLHLSALATDDVGVGSVAFIVNGAPLATLPVAPYEALYSVPADAVPGSSIGIVVQATDFSGNQASAEGTVQVAQTADADATPPTVTLSAPLQVFAGKQLSLSAVAADNVGVASVAFFVDGTNVGTVNAPPYAVSLVLGTSQVAGSVLKLQVKAVDYSGLEASDSAQTLVVSTAEAGQGSVTGEVYDDTTSLPIAGADVRLIGQDNTGSAYTQTTTTDARGRWALSAVEGQGVVQISKTGWTRVDRGAQITSSQAIELFDARLTPIGTATQTLSAVLGGSVTSGAAALTLTAGALATASAITLTPLSAQALEGVLPPGWSPVGAADVLPHGLSFSVPATLSLPSSAGAAFAAPLVVATWDESAGAWRAVGSIAPAQGNAPFVATISASGQYALLLGDAAPSPPPAAAPGALLAGVSLTSLDLGATTVVDPQPKILFYKPGVQSNVHGAIATPTATSSGLPIETRLTESYQFVDGSQLHPEPFVEDLFFYQSGGASPGVSGLFTVTPSQTFDPLTLQLGTISVELLAPPIGQRLVTTLGADGGSVASTTGEAFQLPQGAVTSPLPISVRGLTASTVGVAMPSGVDLMGAVLVSFSGSLTKAAAISVPKPAGTIDASRLLVVRAQEIGGETKLVLVARALVVGTQLVSDTTLGTTANALDGVRIPGRYLFVRTAAPVGFATGTVTTSGAAFAGALVSPSTLAVVGLSNANGRYVAAAPTGSVTLTATDLQKSDSGTSTGTIASGGTVASIDIAIVAAVPVVTSIAPADGATNVPLSTPVVIRFSRAIDPASVNGANAGSVVLTGPDGTPVPASVSLGSGNGVLTLRPSAALQASTPYTITIGTSVADAVGRHLASSVTAHFTSFNTAPPPTPPAGSIAASIPAADGFTTITATQGTAGTHDTVTVVNVTQKTTTPVLVDSNGGFTVRVATALTDKLQIVITGANGSQTVVSVDQFRQVNADGSISTAVTADGALIEGPAGTAVEVPKGAFPNGTVVTLKAIAEADFPVPLDAAARQIITYAGGVQLDLGGVTPEHYLNVFVPAQPDDKPGDQWLVSLVRDDGGTPVLNVVDTAKLINRRVRTSSPPCPGVTGAGVYGVHKTKQSVGVNFGQMVSNGYGGLKMTAAILVPSLTVPLPLPWMALQPVNVPTICYPVLTGNVSVSANTQTITITGTQLAPADREIVVKNTTRQTESHFPHDVVELTFDALGKVTDTFTVVARDSTGVATPVTSVSVTAAASGHVTIRLEPDTITTVAATIEITNKSTNVTTPFPQMLADVKLPVAGGAGDTYEVHVIDVSGHDRTVSTGPIASPTGAGNLVVRAVDGTMDPTQAEIDLYNATHPGPPITGAGRKRVVLVNVTQKSETDVPPSMIANGGFAFPFNGGLTDAYQVREEYDDGKTTTIDVLMFSITVTNATTGRVLRTIVAPSPPKDQPLNLGVLTDDTLPPSVTQGPQNIGAFDPTGQLSFTFSEAMNADSLKAGLVVELVKNGIRTIVKGDVHVSAGNTVATFVPDTALLVGEEYIVTLKGGGLGGITDRSNNALAPLSFDVHTFKPRVIGLLPAELNAANQPIELKDVEVLRRTESGKQKTYAVATTDSTVPTYRVLIVDVTDPKHPTKKGTSIGGSGKKKLTLLTGLGSDRPAMPVRSNPPLVVAKKCDGVTTYTSFTGDLAVTTSYNTDTSYLSFFDISDPANPCHLGNKDLTANPDTLNSTTSPGTVHAIGYARNVATLQTSTGYAAYAAVEQVGLFATNVGQDIPDRTPSEKVSEAYAAGDYSDIVVLDDRLLVTSRSDRTLTLFDANLTPLSTVSLKAEPRRVVTVTGYGVDKNQDGLISPNEQRDLAIVAVDSVSPTVVHSILVVDITNRTGMQVIGEIPMPGIIRELAVDAAKRRVFAGGQHLTPGTPTTVVPPDALYMVDLNNPFSGPVDVDGDQVDDRILWHEDYPKGINGFRLDAKRGVLNVGSSLGLQLWAVYDICCDLGVDMMAQPTLTQTGDRSSILEKEKKALKQEIAAGITDALTKCPGFTPSTISVLEQGSGACLWKTDPATACSGTYQPGISDHDFEVFFPNTVPAGIQSCTADALRARFIDPATDEPKNITIDGSTIRFEDVTFFPFSRNDFESARLNVLPPNSSGTDPTGDLGLGRQQLLLLWLLGGEYVPDIGVGAGMPLSTILDHLTNSNPAIGTGIPRLEGYEWANLQLFNFAKSKAVVRFAGASDAGSSLHGIFVKQLHDVAKAGVRGAFGRLIASTRGNTIAKTITRDGYELNGCLAVNPLTTPDTWTPKPCTSFEEYAASAVAKSVQGPNPTGVFTVAEALKVYRYYRVKSDLERILNDADAVAFIGDVYKSLNTAASATAAIYTQEIATDPNAAQRSTNLNVALTKKLTTATFALRPHVFNRGFVAAEQVELAMYAANAAGSGTRLVQRFIDLAGGEDRFFEFQNDGGTLQLDANGKAIPLFPLSVPMTGGTGTAQGITFTLDLPDKKMKEIVRKNNFGGFFYYVVDPNAAVVTPTPTTPYLPFADPTMLDPDPECDVFPRLEISEQIFYNGAAYNDQLSVPLGATVTLHFEVHNLGQDPAPDVVVTSGVSKLQYSIGTVPGSGTVAKDFTYTAGNEAGFFGGNTVASSSTAGVVEGPQIGLAVGCEPLRLIPPSPDPNPQKPKKATDPDGRVVMRGGTAIRHFLIVSRDTGAPSPGATVTVDVKGPSGTLSYTFTTDSNGRVMTGSDPGMRIPLDPVIPQSAINTVTVTKLNGAKAYCTTTEAAFEVPVVNREFSRSWRAGASIEAGASAAIGLQGKAGTGFGISVDEQAPDMMTKLAVERSNDISAGYKVGGSAKAGLQAGSFKAQVGAQVGLTVDALASASDTHQFTFTPGTNQLPAAQSTALGGLLVATLGAADNPFVGRLLDALVQQVSDLSQYKTSDAVSVGIAVNGSAGVGALAGIAPYDKSGQKYGDLKFGLEAGVGVSAGASAEVGLENKPLDFEVIPSFSFKGNADFSAALDAGSVSTSLDAKTKKQTMDLQDKFGKSVKGTISDTVKVKLTLDKKNSLKPSKLSLSYSSVKGWGWKAGLANEFQGISASGDPDRQTLTFTVTDPDVIQAAINLLQSIAMLAQASGGVSGIAVALGPTQLTNELLQVLQLLAASDSAFEVTTDSGDGIEQALKIDLGAGATIKLGVGVKLDRSISFSNERGVVKAGALYPLEKYVVDSLIPALPADTSDFSNIVQTALNALSNFGSALFSTVQTAVTNGVNTIKSLLTAQLTFDGATAGTPTVALTSFHYVPVAGPVAPAPHRPSDTTGPADLPHYGVGGFHQFIPQDQVLGAPATLTFFYEPQEVTAFDERTLGIYVWNNDTQDWDFLGGTVDPVAHTVTTQVNRLALYTAAPPMPAGAIHFTSSVSSTGPNAPTLVTFTSDAILTNNGQVVPDGSVFTVLTATSGSDAIPLGAVTTPDEDGTMDGVQVTSHGGVIQFTSTLPAGSGAVRAIAYSKIGTALAQQIVTYP